MPAPKRRSPSELEANIAAEGALRDLKSRAIPAKEASLETVEVHLRIPASMRDELLDIYKGSLTLNATVRLLLASALEQKKGRSAF